MMTQSTIIVSSIAEAVEKLIAEAEESNLPQTECPRILDTEGQELFLDGRGGVMYADGANAEYYGPFSD